MATNTLNGGLYEYPQRTGSNIFYGADSHETKKGFLASGNVVKALTWLQTDQNGKLIPHTGLAEGNLVSFADITTGQTLILGGLTFTAGTGSVTAAQLAVIWGNLPAGITAASANTQLLAEGIDPTVTGTFTGGTFGAWNTRPFPINETYLDTGYPAQTKVMFTSTVPLTNVTDIIGTGTATPPVVTKVDGATTFSKVAGITIYDVDASAGDVAIEVYEEASFWAHMLTWQVDPAVDTITLFDGTLKAVTAYNTGTYALDKTSMELLQLKFVEGTEFDLGFISLGEQANG